MVQVFVYRCSDGHVFRSSLIRRLLSVHLFLWKYGPCPVDGSWRLWRPVDPDGLTPLELERVNGPRGR